MRANEKVSFNGVALRVDEPGLGRGGQGEVHGAVAIHDPTLKAVVKTMSPSPEAEARVRWLIDHGLGHLALGLTAPLAMTAQPGRLVTLALRAEGAPLDEDVPRTLPELLEIALLAVSLWTLLEEQGVAHGDVAPGNLLIAPDGMAWLIDFDNASAPGAPPPTMVGQDIMLAPELTRRRRFRRGFGPELGNAPPVRLLTRMVLRRRSPDLLSDRYAWAVLLNILLLGRHPSDGLAQTQAERDEVMSRGLWPERQRPTDPEETPIAALGEALCTLFDQAFSVDPTARPSADMWRRALTKSLARLRIHRCGGAFVRGETQTQCPLCAAPLPSESAATRPKRTPRITLVIEAGGSRRFYALADGDRLVLGRDTLPAATARVSSKHLSLHRRADRLFLKHLGTNPTWERAGRAKLDEAWIALKDIQASPLRLNLADLEIAIRLAP